MFLCLYDGCVCLYKYLLVNLTPSLSNCTARIYAGTRVVAQSDCALEGDDEPLVVWLSRASPTRIQVSYRADFTRAFETPQVTYIRNSPVPIGITIATFSVAGELVLGLVG